MAEPIDMPFGLWVQVGWNHGLDRVQIPVGRGNFEGAAHCKL